jgi:hypothetical protein
MSADYNGTRRLSSLPSPAPPLPPVRGVGIALLLQRAAGIGNAGTVLIGIVGTLVVFGLHLVWESRRGDAALGWRAASRRVDGWPR